MSNVAWYRYIACSCGAVEGEPCIKGYSNDRRTLDRYADIPHSWRKTKKK